MASDSIKFILRFTKISQLFEKSHTDMHARTHMHVHVCMCAEIFYHKVNEKLMEQISGRHTWK
jgi:hypothetical protein